jgi:glycosyltransferase involved in cell wall biosynthesis
MKRILIFSLAYYPQVGGAEVAIKEITDRIGDLEFEMVTLHFGHEARVEQIGKVLVHRVGFGGGYISKILYLPLAAAEAFVLHRQKKFDAAWAMMSYMTLPIMFLRVLGMHLPYILTLQEGDTESHTFSRLRVLPLAPLINAGFRNASIVQAISTYLGAWARRRGFTGTLEVVPNGVDCKRFAIEQMPHEGVTLITSSRLVHKNGIDTVIRALPLIPLVRFVVCGAGQDEQKLKLLAQELGVAGRVIFKGYIDHAELIRELSLADIFIRPSRSEGMGNSFIEAFAAGLPVIATQEGGIADFLFDAKKNPDKPTTGWAVDKDSPEQIAGAVEDILSNPEQSKKVIETAKQLAFGKYDWDLIARDMRVKVFAKILGA